MNKRMYPVRCEYAETNGVSVCKKCGRDYDPRLTERKCFKHPSEIAKYFETAVGEARGEVNCEPLRKSVAEVERCRRICLCCEQWISTSGDMPQSAGQSGCGIANPPELRSRRTDTRQRWVATCFKTCIGQPDKWLNLDLS